MDDNPLLKNANIAVTKRLGFPEVIMPGKFKQSTEYVRVYESVRFLFRSLSDVLLC